jgi:cytochrome c-type biogenesis protein CcmH
MMFWILAAVMTVAVAIILLVPLARRADGGANEQDFDIEVYRDQLREIDRDVENALISNDQAEFARAEVGRRLIKASKLAKRRTSSSGRAALIGRIAVLLILPGFAMAGYLSIGNPGLPSQPFAARQNAVEVEQNGRDVEALVADAESHLARNPQDGKGWDVLAPIYMRLGRLPQAETAYRNAIRLLGSSAVRQAGLGQVLFARAGGIVTADSQNAFQAVIDFEPENPFAAYFLALALAQEGKTDAALQAFADIAEKSPPDAPWMAPVRQQMRRLSGPDEDDVETAMSMSPVERREMIVAMVAGLDAKLQENPDDLQGWLRLIQSYMVLGQVEEAGRAFAQASDSFAKESVQQKTLDELAADLGLEIAGQKAGPTK